MELKRIKYFIILFISFLLIGCGRIYHIKGKVVVLPKSDEIKGTITELTDDSIPNVGNGVTEVTISMIHELDSDNKPVGGTIWIKKVKTDNEGLFEIEDYATPGSKNLVGLEINKKGYNTLYTTYWDYADVLPQVFFIILVPDTMNIQKR